MKHSALWKLVCSPEMKDSQMSEERYQTFQQSPDTVRAADSTVHSACLSYHLHLSTKAAPVIYNYMCKVKTTKDRGVVK